MKMAGILYKRLSNSKGMSFYRLVLILFLSATCLFTAFRLHPYYMSVTELEYQPAEKEVQIAAKIFIDDLEYALSQEYKQKVEILKEADKKKNEVLLTSFFQKHLKLTINGKPVNYTLIGFDREEEAIWSYLVVKDVSPFKTATVFTDLLYGFRQDQINILHFKNGTDRKSKRLTYPDKQVSFSW